MLPKIKKKVTGFLLSEEGKIPKQSLVALGSFLSAAVIGGVIATKEAAADHSNSFDVGYSGNTASATHVHHANHSSHGSHASHASHASGTTAGTTATTGDDGGTTSGTTSDCGDCV